MRRRMQGHAANCRPRRPSSAQPSALRAVHLRRERAKHGGQPWRPGTSAITREQQIVRDVLSSCDTTSSSSCGKDLSFSPQQPLEFLQFTRNGRLCKILRTSNINNKRKDVVAKYAFATQRFDPIWNRPACVWHHGKIAALRLRRFEERPGNRRSVMMMVVLVMMVIASLFHCARHCVQQLRPSHLSSFERFSEVV